MRDFHGEEEPYLRYQTYDLGRNIFGYQTHDLGIIMKGLYGENLERLLQLHLQIVKCFLMFSLIYAWPISL
jgi:hypothetical protein